MQTQDHPGTVWAMGLRLPGCRKSKIDAAISGLNLKRVMYSLAFGSLLLLGACKPSDVSLPHYTMEQTASSHSGYRRTTLTSGTTV